VDDDALILPGMELMKNSQKRSIKNISISMLSSMASFLISGFDWIIGFAWTEKC